MAGVAGLHDNSLLDQSLKTVGQDIRRNPFDGIGQELAKMSSVHEDDVANDEQTPLVAKELHH